MPVWSCRRSSDVLTGTARNANLRAVVFEAVTDAGGLAVLGERHLADVDRTFLGDDPALLGAARSLVGLPRVALHEVHAFDDHALALGVDGDHLAGRALVLAGDDDDVIALLDLHQSTSGASEMMRMNFLSRSSRPTGPKIRVPRGSPPSRMSTAAFSSKRMYEPSARRRSFTVRTMTSFPTSPFFTDPPGMASLTVATITSPMPA